MKKDSTITWTTKLVAIEKIKSTPKNYKIKNALGAERLKTSLAKFGLAGTVVCNTDLTLIDGNSRFELMKLKKDKFIEVSVPSRKLLPKEFSEMSAMFDFAKAGEVDIERIQGDLGTTKDFYKNWNIEPPLESLGHAGHLKEMQKVKTNGKSGAQKEEVVEKIKSTDMVLVQLFFTEKQEAEFRRIEDKLKKRFKQTTTTDTIFAVYKSLAK
jgi:hypothetical protein